MSDGRALHRAGWGRHGLAFRVQGGEHEKMCVFPMDRPDCRGRAGCDTVVGVAMELLLFLLSEPEFSPFRMILRDLLIAFPLCAIPCALGAGIVPLLYAACSAICRALWHRKKSGDPGCRRRAEESRG